MVADGSKSACPEKNLTFLNHHFKIFKHMILCPHTKAISMSITTLSCLANRLVSTFRVGRCPRRTVWAIFF